MYMSIAIQPQVETFALEREETSYKVDSVTDEGDIVISRNGCTTERGKIWLLLSIGDKSHFVSMPNNEGKADYIVELLAEDSLKIRKSLSRPVEATPAEMFTTWPEALQSSKITIEQARTDLVGKPVAISYT